jgi:small-conductance mechanosensitive channel
MDWSFLDFEYFGLTILRWGEILILWIAISGLLFLLRHLFLGRFTRLAARTENRIDDVVAELLRGTRKFFLFLIALYVAVEFFTEDAPAIPVLLRIVFLGSLLQIGLWGNELISLGSKWYAEKDAENAKENMTAVAALSLIIRTIVWSVILLLALDNFGVDITALVAGLGIGGIAIALAVQNILQDLLAYISILVDKPFVYGDYLVIGDFSGTVEHVGIKTTRIRSLSGEQIVFSNADLLQSRLRNYKHMAERRVVFGVGVTYDTPHVKLTALSGLLQSVVDAQPDIRFDRAHLKSFGDSAILYEVVYYAIKPDYAFYMDTQEAINLEIHRRFEEEGIEFAFPTQTIHIESMPGTGGSD